MGNASGTLKTPPAVLLQPAMEGNLDKVKELVGTFLASYSSSNLGYVPPGSDPKLQEFVNRTDAQGNNAIHGAVFAGHLGILQYLAERCGASLELPNALGCSPTWLAAGYDRVDILIYLLGKLANPKDAMLLTNSTGDTPLLAASSRGNLDCCTVLLEKAGAYNIIGEIMETPNRNGDLPLHVAIGSGLCTETLLELLLNHSKTSSLNVPNKNGLTPLLVGCERGDAKILKKLLDRHVDTSHCDPSGASPLAVAAFCGSKDALQVLLQHDASCSSNMLEKPNKSGCTPLWLAARSGRPEIVELLLQAGADPTIENHDGISPIGAAAKYKRDCVMELFQHVDQFKSQRKE